MFYAESVKIPTRGSDQLISQCTTDVSSYCYESLFGEG